MRVVYKSEPTEKKVAVETLAAWLHKRFMSARASSELVLRAWDDKLGEMDCRATARMGVPVWKPAPEPEPPGFREPQPYRVFRGPAWKAAEILGELGLVQLSELESRRRGHLCENGLTVVFAHRDHEVRLVVYGPGLEGCGLRTRAESTPAEAFAAEMAHQDHHWGPRGYRPWD